MHRLHYSALRAALIVSFAASLALSACAFVPPGALGYVTNRPPPPAVASAIGPYANPLAEPLPPLVDEAAADAIVGADLLPSLGPDARLQLAEASQEAAIVATGDRVFWKAADADGVVAGDVVPVRDVYRSHRGAICRDMQQRIGGDPATPLAQVTLCRSDLGDNRILWVPGSPD